MIAPDQPSQAPADDDPFAVFGGLGPQLGVMLLLAAVAVMVVWFSRRVGKRVLRSRGKMRPNWADPVWRARVESLQASPTQIADAKPGDVCVIATLSAAPLALGGPTERACVWRNTMGADASTAIAADLVFVADDTGRAALEHLDHARVIAPPEPAPGRRGAEPRRIVALYLGDRVEICARFAVDRAGDEADPRNLVYGTLGALGPVEVRVIDRPIHQPKRPDAAVSSAPETPGASVPSAPADNADEGSPQ